MAVERSRLTETVSKYDQASGFSASSEQNKQSDHKVRHVLTSVSAACTASRTLCPGKIEHSQLSNGANRSRV